MTKAKKKATNIQILDLKIKSFRTKFFNQALSICRA